MAFRGPFWNPERDRSLREACQSFTNDESIAQHLTKVFRHSVSRASVAGRRNRLGIPAPNLNVFAEPSDTDRPPPPPDDEPEISIDVEFDETPPVASTDEDAEERVFAILSKLTRRGSVSLEEACDALDLSPKATRVWIDAARDRGYRFELDGDSIGQRPIEASSEVLDVQIQRAGQRHVIAIVGDIHFGSKHHLRSQFQDFCGLAYERGARTFLHVGDMLDGVYKHSRWEQSARGYEEQVEVAIEQLPRWDDAAWWWIQGNHDETLGEDSGLEVGRAVDQSFRAAGRNDLTYLGPRSAYIRLRAPDDKRGLYVELWHPGGKGGAYAKSYKIQKKIEAYPPGAKPDVVGVGHYHQSMFMTARGVHAISAGCFQGGQSSFGKSLPGAPDIGSWIIEYALTEQGTVREFRPEWIAYYEQETVREIGLT